MAGASAGAGIAKEKSPREASARSRKKKRSREVEEPVVERDPYGRLYTAIPGCRISKRKKKTNAHDEGIAAREPEVYDIPDSSSSSSEGE